MGWWRLGRRAEVGVGIECRDRKTLPSLGFLGVPKVDGSDTYGMEMPTNT